MPIVEVESRQPPLDVITGMQRAVVTPRRRLLVPTVATLTSAVVLWLTLTGALPPDTQLVILLVWVGVALQVLRWRREYARKRGYDLW